MDLAGNRQKIERRAQKRKAGGEGVQQQIRTPGPCKSKRDMVGGAAGRKTDRGGVFGGPRRTNNQERFYEKGGGGKLNGLEVLPRRGAVKVEKSKK